MSGKTNIFISISLLLFGIAFFYGCKSTTVSQPLRIALSSGSENYFQWVHRGDSLVEIIDMKGMTVDSALQLLTTCDAIVFTGGEDVVPAYYGKNHDSARCETNPGRDSLEFSLIRKAMRLQMPVFGVCRGQQILNVALGGTLIVDIPTDHPGNICHRCEDYTRCFHQVSVVQNSLFHTIVKADTGKVTTNHHQAIEKPAPGLHVVAWSADSIAEAIEWNNPKQKPFLLAVQWHPERMKPESPLSMPLLKAFIEAAKVFKTQK